MNNWSWLAVVWWLRHFVVTKRRRVERVCWGCSVDFTSNLSQTRSPIEWYSSRRWRDARTTLFSFLFFLCNLTSQLLWAWNWDIPGWVVTLIYLHVLLLFLLCFAVFFPLLAIVLVRLFFKNSLAIATALSTAHEKSQWDTKAAACLKINLKTDLLLLKVNKNDIFYWFLLSLPIMAWLSSPCAVSGRWQRSRSVSIYTQRKIHCCLFFLLSFM